MNQGFRGRRGRLTLLLSTALVAGGVAAGSASAATTTFTDGHVVIPDDKPGKPYPATTNVSGVAGNVSKVTATLHDFVHSCPSDISVLLQAPGGAHSILLGQTGGCDNNTGPIDVTFDQAAATTVPDPVVSGTFRPTDDGAEPFASPAPGPPYQANLNVFNGPANVANGAWKLFVHDQVAGDAGGLGSWSLSITAPFNTSTLGKPSLNKKKGTAKLPVTVGDAGKITLKGKGVKSASKSTAGPGTVTLTVKPKGKTRSKLLSTGKATVKVNVTFTPNGGAAKSVSKKIKLKKTL